MTEKSKLLNILAILEFTEDQALKDKLLLKLAELDLEEKLVFEKKF